MNAASNPQIQVLLTASARDERSLQFDLDHEVFGLLAQQAIEKLLKALISAHGEKFAYVHDLDKLAIHLQDLGESLPAMPLTWTELTVYAHHARYDVGKAIPKDVRSELRSAVADLRVFVEKRVKELAAAGTQVKNP